MQWRRQARGVSEQRNQNAFTTRTADQSCNSTFAPAFQTNRLGPPGGVKFFSTCFYRRSNRLTRFLAAYNSGADNGLNGDPVPHRSPAELAAAGAYRFTKKRQSSSVVWCGRRWSRTGGHHAENYRRRRIGRRTCRSPDKSLSRLPHHSGTHVLIRWHRLPYSSSTPASHVSPLRSIRRELHRVPAHG